MALATLATSTDIEKSQGLKSPKKVLAPTFQMEYYFMLEKNGVYDLYSIDSGKMELNKHN